MSHLPYEDDEPKPKTETKPQPHQQPQAQAVAKSNFRNQHEKATKLPANDAGSFENKIVATVPRDDQETGCAVLQRQRNQQAQMMGDLGMR